MTIIDPSACDTPVVSLYNDSVMLNLIYTIFTFFGTNSGIDFPPFINSKNTNENTGVVF